MPPRTNRDSPHSLLATLRRMVDATAALPGKAMAAMELRPRHLRAAAAHLLARELLHRHLRSRGLLPEGPLFPPGGASDGAFARALLWVERQRSLAAADLPANGLPPQQLGDLHAELLHHGTRKSQGAWFTDASLTRPTVARTLRPLLATGDALRLRICDPAVGSGAFLLAALDHLATATGAARAEVASNCLFGVDVDPTTAALAAWTLWDACAEPDLPITRILAHVHAGDGLSDLPRDAFDVVLGNPPWETLQPSRKEFFAELVGGYRELGHQQALRSQRLLFELDPAAGADWTATQRQCAARAKAMRARFRHQGPGKLFTYRLFLEQALHLLRDGGRLGLIVPSSFCFDRDAAPLRRLLFERCQWEWLFLFENRRGLFPIDSRYRFGPIVAQKGGCTLQVRTAFGRQDPADWERAEPPHLIYPRSLVQHLSPRHGVLLELQHERDLELLRRLHAAGQPMLAGSGGSMKFAQGDFNLTSKSHLFTTAAQLHQRGAVPGPDGRWRSPSGDTFAPLYQGAMIYDLHPHVADHAGGAGHRTRWREPRELSVLRPQFFVAAEVSAQRRPLPLVRVGFRTLSNATNERTTVACLLGDLPCGNSLGLLTPSPSSPTPVLDCAFGAGVMGSLVFDWAMRQRLAGTNLNRFVLEESVWPEADVVSRRAIARLALQLSAILPWHEPLWQAAREEGWLLAGWQRHGRAACGEAERRRLRVELDVLVARAFGIRGDDLGWMLRDCDLPVPDLVRGRARLDPKGFWRIDRHLPPEDRHPARVLQAMRATCPEPTRWLAAES